MINEIDESDADVFLDADEFDGDEFDGDEFDGDRTPSRPGVGDVLRRVVPWLAALLVIVGLVFTFTERAASQGPLDADGEGASIGLGHDADATPDADPGAERDPGRTDLAQVEIGAGRAVDGGMPRSPGASAETVGHEGSPGIAVAAASIVGVDRLIARAQPDADAAVVVELIATADEPVTVLAVADHAGLHRQWNRQTAGGRWLEVHLPVRPNGTTGWIPLADVELFRNAYRIEVDRASFTLTVFEENQPLLEVPVAIGTGDTPTPAGTFYTEDLLRVADPDGPYGPYAFVLSGHSEHLSSFNGGNAIIGIHGTDNPAALGSEVSHGCIRLHNDVITELAEFIPLGTPIVIT